MNKLRLVTGGWLLLASMATHTLALDVNLTGLDAFGTSSFNTAGLWSNSAAPSAGNDYFVGDGALLRTPNNGDSHTFAGNSLTISNTTAYPEGLFYKGSGTTAVITVNNLILDGGLISHAQGTTDIFKLDGTINVASTSRIYAKQGFIEILSDISGTGGLEIQATDDNSSSGQRIVTLLGDNSAYTGNINVLGKLTAADTSTMAFDIGPSGVNNSILGTGWGVFNGTFSFDLTGASMNPGDSWLITNVTNQTYGTTFGVGGGFSQVGSVWTDGTYTFTPGTGILSVSQPPVEWGVDNDGNFSVNTNWSGGNAPIDNEDALFGGIITANRTVTIDQPISLNRITFSNTDGDYFLVPDSNQVLTLVSQAAVDSAAGRHWLSVEVAGTSGLTKEGTGELILDHANSFSGGLTISNGRLSVTHPNAIPSGQNVELTATSSNLLFGGDNGFFVENGSTGGGYVGGTVNGIISGAGTVTASNGAEVSLTGANTYSGTTTVTGTETVLTLSGGGTLGAADGTVASNTRIGGTAQVVLDGVAVGDEVLYLDERADEGTPAHLSSSGSSSWSGNIKADIPGVGSHYKIQATSGTLELSGIISAWDEAAPNDRFYVFDSQGTSNINVTGSITDLETDADGEFLDTDMNDVPDGTDDGANLHVIKRGSGTLTISTGGVGDASDYFHFHRATTVIEQGTLAVVDSQTANAGELLSSTIEVRSGAIFDTSAFTNYSLQVIEDPDETPFNGDEIGQTLSGAGTVNNGTGNTISAFEDSVIAPGDPGTPGRLIVTGNMTIDQSQANPNGALNFELTNSAAAVNDQLQVNGELKLLADGAAGGGQFKLNVTPVAGNLDSSRNYVLMTAGLTTNSTATAADFDLNIVNQQGTTLNTRQDNGVAVDITSTQVRIQFAPAASLTWNGTSGNNAWDVGTSNNWSGSDSSFLDLDNATFSSGASEKNVVVNTAVTPGSTTFNSASTYTFTGEGGIEGSGAVNVNAGTVRFQNAGNNYTGTTTVASGATLEMDTASTGTMVLDGRLTVGSTGLSALSEFTYVDAVHNANTALTGGGALVPATDIWEVRTGIGGNGDTIYEADANDLTTAPEIQTTISGLSANTTYTVYANFWDATGASWQIQAGDTPGNLALYANPADNVAGATAGVLTSTLPHTSQLSTASGNRTLFSAPLGEFTTDGSGTLVVYIDDKGTDEGDNRAFYDGLSYNSGVTNVFGGGSTLTVDGNLSLNSGSNLDLDLGAVGFDSLLVTGTALLDGTIDVSYFGDAPEDGMQYTVLTANGGIITPLGSLDFGAGLPENFTASYNDALTQLILTFSAGLDGDFNGDGIVNLADYTVWRDNLGNPDESVLMNNGDDMNGVDTGDYALWKSNFGATSGAGALGTLQGGQQAVPEPGTVCIVIGMLGIGAIAVRRRAR